jgi:uroporphyrinogen-III decarboxylase
MLEKGGNDPQIGDRGVDILSPACGLSPKTPTENIRAMSAVIRDIRRVRKIEK